VDACETKELVFPDVLAEPGEAIRHVYFPTESFISLVAPMGGKNNLEVAMGVATSPVHALVQGGGPALRIGAAAFRRELARTPALRNCIDRYVYVMMS